MSAPEFIHAGFPGLVCPQDHLPLAARGDHLCCAHSHAYPVRERIPRILKADGAYTDTFGEQWNHYRTTQLDSYTGTTISRDRLHRCLGEGLLKKMAGETLLDVLEAGCGAGRFTELLLQYPAVRLTSTDLSSAVEANQANCPQSIRHRVVQCDINGMPFAPGRYDIVVCLGVIQHTPSPEAAIAALYDQVKPGGWLVIDHYRPSLSQYTKISALLLRPLIKRLPPRAGTRVTEALTRLFFPLHRSVKRSFALQALLSRVSPLLTYYHAYPQLDDRLQHEWALLDTHDSLADYYKHLRTRQQIAQVLAGLGAVDLWVERGGNGIEARCRRPVAEGAARG